MSKKIIVFLISAFFIFVMSTCVSSSQSHTVAKPEGNPFKNAKPVQAVLTQTHGSLSNSTESTVQVWQSGDTDKVNWGDFAVWVQDAALDEHKAPWYDVVTTEFGVITPEIDKNTLYRVKLQWFRNKPADSTVQLRFLNKSGTVKNTVLLKENAVQVIMLGDEDKYMIEGGVVHVYPQGGSTVWGTKLRAIPNPKFANQQLGELTPAKSYPQKAQQKQSTLSFTKEQIESLQAGKAGFELGSADAEIRFVSDRKHGIDVPAPVKFALMADNNDTLTICIGVDKKELVDKAGKYSPLEAFKKRAKNIEKMHQLGDNLFPKQPKNPIIQKLSGSFYGYITIKLNPETKNFDTIDYLAVFRIGSTGVYTNMFLFGPVPAFIQINGSLYLVFNFAAPVKGGQNQFVNFTSGVEGIIGVEGGIGVPLVLSAALEVKATTKMQQRKTEDPNNDTFSGDIDIDASVKAVVFVFYNWNYRFLNFRGHMFGEKQQTDSTIAEIPIEPLYGIHAGGNYRLDKEFLLNDESYQVNGDSFFVQDELPQAGIRNEQTVVKNVPFGTEPQIFQVGSEEVMIWIAPAPASQGKGRPKFNDFCLQYATRKKGSNGEFENKGMINDLKIDGQYTNDSSFTAIEFKGYLYLAWVKMTKPLAKGQKPQDSYASTAIYTQWYSPAGWGAGEWGKIEKITKDDGYLQYMPQFTIQKTPGIGYDYLYLSWVGKKNNDYFANQKGYAQTTISFAWRTKYSENWDFNSNGYDPLDQTENLFAYATGYEPSFVQSMDPVKPFSDGYIAMIIENMNAIDKKIWFLKRAKQWESDDIGTRRLKIVYISAFTYETQNASNTQMGLIDGKQTAFWYENGEVKYCNIAEVINTKNTSAIKTINGGVIQINSNYQLIRDSHNNVKGLTWDDSGIQNGAIKSASQGYALPYLQKEKMWAKAVPITYRDDNSVVTNPSGFIRENGDWVIAYRKLVQYNNTEMTPKNFVESRVDACVANMSKEPVINTFGMFEDDKQFQHVGKKMNFTVMVNNFGLSSIDNATILIKDKDGKKLGEVTTNGKILPGEMKYVSGRIDNLIGTGDVVPKTDIIATAQYKGKNSEFSKSEARYTIGVPDLLVHNIYIQTVDNKPVAKMYLSSLNGVTVPAGSAELVITETEFKGYPNRDIVESVPVVRVKPINVKLTDTPQLFEEVCTLEGMNDYDTVVTKRYSFALRLKGDKATEFAEFEYQTKSSGDIMLESPFLSKPAVDISVLHTEYNPETKKIGVMVAIFNNMGEKFSDTICIDLFNDYTKEVSQSVKTDVVIPAHGTRQVYLEFAPITGSTGANEYAVRAHGDGGKFFGSIYNWQKFLHLVSSTLGTGSHRVELTVPLTKNENLYAIIEKEYGFILRKQVRDYLFSANTTVQDLYEAVQAETAPLMQVRVK